MVSDRVGSGVRATLIWISEQNQGRIFLAGPPLVKAATGEVVNEETLGEDSESKPWPLVRGAMG